jgi:hypothetical protein
VSPLIGLRAPPRKEAKLASDGRCGLAAGRISAPVHLPSAKRSDRHACSLRSMPPRVRPREVGEHGRPVEVVTDMAPSLLRAVDELLPGVCHDTERSRNNRIECDHGRLKARLRPMRGLQRDRSAAVVIRGHAFVQNLRRGHYDLGVDARLGPLRVAATFDELALAI